MKIYESRQNLFAKGLPRPSADSMAEELTYLIAALANEKSIHQVVPLLDSLPDRTDHPMVANRSDVLLLSLRLKQYFFFKK